VTEPWSPETAQSSPPASWRDPAAWQEDPAKAAQAARAELTSTAQATAAQVASTAQATAVQLTSTAHSLLADFETRTADRPEMRIGAAFAGGLLSALILRRLAR
jgi:cell division septum initiation protein DivIVA